MREHGYFEMERHEQVILIKVFGTWNLETTMRWCIEYKRHIESIKHSPWARILDLTFWELTTPDVWAYVDEVNSWANNHNQKFEIVICPLSLQKMQLKRAHQLLSNVEIKYCQNLQEARNLLASSM